MWGPEEKRETVANFMQYGKPKGTSFWISSFEIPFGRVPKTKQSPVQLDKGAQCLMLLRIYMAL
jgi:hypothetical protein